MQASTVTQQEAAITKIGCFVSRGRDLFVAGDTYDNDDGDGDGDDDNGNSSDDGDEEEEEEEEEEDDGKEESSNSIGNKIKPRGMRKFHQNRGRIRNGRDEGAQILKCWPGK